VWSASDVGDQNRSLEVDPVEFVECEDLGPAMWRMPRGGAWRARSGMADVRGADGRERVIRGGLERGGPPGGVVVTGRASAAVAV